MPAKLPIKQEIPTVANMFIDGFLSTKFIARVTKLPEHTIKKQVTSGNIIGQEYDLAERNGEPELPVTLIPAPYMKLALLRNNLPIPQEIEDANLRYIKANDGHLANICFAHDYPPSTLPGGQEFYELVLSPDFMAFTGIFTLERVGQLCNLDWKILLRFIKRRELKYKKPPVDNIDMHRMVFGPDILDFLKYWKYPTPEEIVKGTFNYCRLRKAMKGDLFSADNLARINKVLVSNAHATRNSLQPASHS